ncbi:DUF4331 domain-containing protein [bacterium]|nr:DUF4331 domain-containing protein [bacterium]NCQ55454.1 DUF4331 domain-containing protein [Candidatus Parcubacteria bacterium]NCS67816.1 DUF4331 domain-containing protein [Candidatus Peregrinibacteria bacterium]NCS96370.1 DUF4331 domain-containing protein [bacterium]
MKNIYSNSLKIAMAAIVIGGTSMVHASSHREAPKISQDPAADQTDLYAFRSPTNPDNLVIAGNYYPLIGPGAGPNYYRFSDDVIYAFHVDQNGDAKEDITYAFRFSTTVKDPSTFLAVTSPMTSASDLNVVQSYKAYKIMGQIKDLEGAMNERNVIASGVTAPPVIGEKSQPDYESLAMQAVIETNQRKFFAGARDDSFFVDLNVFDLLNLGAGVDSLEGKNVQSIVMEVPISNVTRNADTPIIGVWGATYRYSPDVKTVVTSSTTVSNMNSANSSNKFINTTLIERQKGFVQNDRRYIYSQLQNSNGRRFEYGIPSSRYDGKAVNARISAMPRAEAANNNASNNTNTMTKMGGWKQISRLGMPLVNEVVVPLQYKDYFNSSHPMKDAETQVYVDVVRKPILAGLLKAVLGLEVPTDNRDDLVTVFLTGVPDLNMPADVQPAEMLRLNTSIPVATTENRLGVFGGDVAGFPNGRRLADDVTDIAIQAVAGKLVDGYDVPAELGDGVNTNDKAFKSSFPYLAMPNTMTQ